MATDRREHGPDATLSGGQSNILRILSGGAANGLVSRVESAFKTRTSFELVGDYGAVGVMNDRILAHEPVDLIILTRALIDDLAKSGHVDVDSIRDIGNVVTGIAVRDGEPVPDLGSSDALAQVLGQADALYVPDTVQSTAGRHVAGMLETLGMTNRLKARLREFPNGQTAMAAMAREGSARSLGCTQITEILNTPGVTYAGDLPAGHGLSTVYTAAISTDARSATAARMLIDILTAPETAGDRQSSGFA